MRIKGSLGFKIVLLDPGEKTDEESSLVHFSGDANIPTAGHLLPQSQTKQIPCQISCHTDESAKPRVQHKLHFLIILL